MNNYQITSLMSDDVCPGKTIQTLIETNGVNDISLEDDGLIQIESFSDEKNQAAKDAISS